VPGLLRPKKADMRDFKARLQVIDVNQRAGTNNACSIVIQSIEASAEKAAAENTVKTTN
jgi:hypothetical protein